MKDSFLSGSVVPRNSVVKSWEVANSCLVLWVLAYSLDRVSFHTYLLESTDFSPLYSLHCFFFALPFFFPLAAEAPEAGLSSCFSREEKRFSQIFCSRYRNTIFQVWCSLSFHLFEQYFECAETAMILVVLTFEADGNINYPTISSSGCSFIVVSSHRVLNECALSLCNSISKTDSSVSLTLKYS